jgi:hemolysin III
MSSDTAVLPLRLYDARRAVYYDRPLLRGRLHAVCFLAALVLAPLMIAAERRAAALAVACVYGTCVAALFGVSAVYHCRAWGAVMMRRLHRLDHLMIVLMIAGSATPPLALSAPQSLRLPALCTLWALATLAIVVRVLWPRSPERTVGMIYVGLGWIAGAGVPAVWLHNGVGPAVLLLVGGLLYTAGALFYHRRAFDLVPSVFGYHETFHLCVSLAAACQFVAIALFVL